MLGNRDDGLRPGRAPGQCWINSTLVKGLFVDSLLHIAYAAGLIFVSDSL